MFIIQCQETLGFLVRANSRGATLGAHIEATVFNALSHPDVQAFKAQGLGIIVIYLPQDWE